MDKVTKIFSDTIQSDAAIWDDVKKEQRFQFNRWGPQFLTLNEWLNFLTEEVGELASAISDENYDRPRKTTIYHEAIQVASLATKIADMVRINDKVDAANAQ